MKTKKQLEAENSILWISVIILFVIGVTATIGCISYKSEPQEECECLDKYWEQQYNTIKNLYDFDEALLKYGTKIDSGTWSLPLEYAPEF